MRCFETRGPVSPEDNYVVTRADELADFITRVEKGRYIVLFAPRQTGKTSFFQSALELLEAEMSTYFPIRLNFDTYAELSLTDFYGGLYEDLREEIRTTFQRLGREPSEPLTDFLENTELTNAFSMRRFFSKFARFLNLEYSDQKVVLIIDEFDGIPEVAVSGFLNALRHIYLTGKDRCIYSIGIIGVKSITQLNYDRSISPFNIQDEFNLSNFTVEQVRELLAQYTEETGQCFEPEAIEMLHKQTGGQPFLVNRFAQILTEELEIPKTEPITMAHFRDAYVHILDEDNTNISHLLTNIRRDPRFENFLMRIASYDKGVHFSRDNEIIAELATYGVLTKDARRMCKIASPIYQHRIMQAFKPLVNGLEHEYFPEDSETNFMDYVAFDGTIALTALLNNFQAFIARVGFRILQVPETPQEFVGQYLLYAYLDEFVQSIGGAMYLEVQAGRGKIDLLIIHKQRKYIVETKIWEGERRYRAGKDQLLAYLKLEQATEGYYVVFDHRQNTAPRVETETLEGIQIRSYVIPVMQERPSAVSS